MRGSPQTLQATTLPAPTGGMDSRQNLADSPPNVSIYCYNMNPSEYGLTVRRGYRQWCAPLDLGASTGVKTLIPYNGDEDDGASDKLFAVTNEGIWDVTTEGAPGVNKLVFTDQTEGAGHGVYTAFTSDAGTQLLFYADRNNGLFQYDPNAETWLQSSVVGLDATSIVFVVAHKQRLWFAERASDVGWYLALGAIAGTATPFFFGSKFKRGGDLAGLFNWSVDAGDGIDDYLVAIGRGGDVIPYRGSDPSQPDWSQVGTYYIGQVPRGHKIAEDYAGDLLILSEFGVTAMTDLLRGSSGHDPTQTSVTFKIARIIRNNLRKTIGEYGWELRYIPNISLLIINSPKQASGAEVQYVMARTTEGWALWRDVPMDCVESWVARAVFGTANSTVEIMDERRDGLTPTDNAGSDIEFSLLFSYQHFGDRSTYKRAEFARPTFIGPLAPRFRMKMLYDFSINEIVLPTDFTIGQASLWDIGNWDEAFWAESGYVSNTDIRGMADLGRSMAIAINGHAVTETILVNIDVMWRSGGYL